MVNVLLQDNYSLISQSGSPFRRLCRPMTCIMCTNCKNSLTMTTCQHVDLCINSLTMTNLQRARQLPCQGPQIIMTVSPNTCTALQKSTEAVNASDEWRHSHIAPI